MRNKNYYGKRLFSMALAMTMAAEIAPMTGFIANAEYDQNLVSSLTKVYNGDEARALQLLDALHQAGIIDEDGNMIELDIKENGTAVTLDDLSARISNGGTVGDITVNGHASNAEQIMKLQQAKTTLQIVQMMNEEVTITDEHVANLESLIEGIGEGTVDIDNALRTGTLRLGNRGISGPTETTVSTGTVNATNGKYTAPYISGSTYNAQYSFALSDASNNNYYVDSNTNGIVADGIITLSADKSSVGKNGDTVTVTATLNKAQTMPVSFDWSVGGGGFTFATSSGTVNFAAGDTSKTFTVTVPAKASNDLWSGNRTFVINVSNVKNAKIDDDSVTTNTVSSPKTAWSQKITVASTDQNSIFGSIDNWTLVGSTTDTIQVSRVSVVGCWFNNVTPGSYIKIKYFANNLTIDGELYRIDKFAAILHNDSINENSSQTYGEKQVYSTDSAGYLKFPYECNVYLDSSYNGCFNNGSIYIAGRMSNSTQAIDNSTAGRYGSRFTKMEVYANQSKTNVSISNISVPAGTYYSGQVVPITVTLSDYAVANANTKLKVNNVNCNLIDSAGMLSKTFTFGYTVKDVDTGAINVTDLTGLVNTGSQAVNVINRGSMAQSFDTDDDVSLVSKVKESSLDFTNLKYGIDDAMPLQQTATVFIPFKANAALDWLTQEYTEFTSPIDMPVPGYANATTQRYLNSAYFSYDGGKTRYPAYIIQDGTNEAVGLAAKIAPPANETGDLRLDTLNLFMDMNAAVTSAATYLDGWDNKKTDVNGFAYFTPAANQAAAPVVIGPSYSYYVKGCLFFELKDADNKDVYTARIEEPEEDFYENKVKNGWLNLGDNNHILLNDAEHPNNQYDVEIVADDAFYTAATTGARAEDTNDMTLKAQFSSRKNFTFTDPQYFTWTSSDESVAKVTTDEQGVAHIALTGETGEVTFTLNVGNCVASKAYNVPVTAKLTVLEGKTPFLNISKYSQQRITLTETPVDISFASNLTARNAQAGQDTTFTAKLKKQGSDDVVWTDTFTSTLAKPITHITVPGDKLSAKGEYTVEISSSYVGGEVEGAATTPQELSATANITVKQAPAKITLDKLGSYYVTADKLPEIKYTASNGAEVQYTIQKSGGALGDRKNAADGTIPFSVDAPTNLKESYTITVYARNAGTEDAWSVDSMLLTVYNPDILEQIVKDVTAGQIGGTTGGVGVNVEGTTVDLDNHGKISGTYGVDEEGEYKLTFDDFTTLRTDMSLQKIISINYGEQVYGLLSDKMQWKSSDSSLASVNYKQGGIYSDIRNYSYTSYTPATDFLLVAKDDISDENKVTVTATHANTGIKSSFNVTASTLKDQLYLFKFNPAVETDVTYTNGDGEKRVLKSNDKGELAVYEPSGIASSVMTMSKVGNNKTYVGTLYPSDLATGERDIASLQLYPCNNLRLRAIANADLTFIKPDGTPYNGVVTIRGGVYKNGVYCPGAKIRISGESVDSAQIGRENINATVTNGKLNLTLDPFQFNVDSTETQGAQPGDKITYVFEYSFGETYRPGYVVLNASTDVDGASSPTDSLVQMLDTTGEKTQPQIIRQNIQQYYGDQATPYTRNVVNYTDNIGVSKKFDKTDLTTEVALLNETVSSDDRGYTTYQGEDVTRFALYTPNNKKLTGQTEDTKTTADQIINLSDMDDSTLFVFPFSSVPIARSIYTMTDSNLSADGITDEGTNPYPTSAVKVMFKNSNMTVKSETLKFGVSNLSHQKDLSQKGGGTQEIGNEIQNELKSKLNIGSIFNDIDVNDMLKKGFVFLSNIKGTGGDNPIDMMIMPTEDPGRFRIVAFVGSKKADDDEEGGNLSVNYDPNQLYDDMEAFNKELKEMENEKKNNKSKNKDDDDGGESFFDLNYYGTIVLEAKVGTLGDSWDIDFCGGTVGTNFEAKYDWSQNFMCGPVPVNVSFSVTGTADLEVSFANKADARALLIDAAVGVSIDAFAGLGFDYSLVALKLGIFGNIGAKDNFLYLTNGNQTGNKLDISGEIGIKMEAKVLMVSYEHTFCSTGFNWSKKWGNYDGIKREWEEKGFVDLTTTTTQGRSAKVRLFSNGTAMFDINGGGQIENRNYLSAAPKRLRGNLPNDGMTTLQEIAYPYSNPVVNDDGSIMLFISDNGNADKLQNVVSYAVKNGDSYDIKGAVDTSEDNILADSDVVASGTGSNAFAAWVKQMDSPEKEMGDKANYDDLGMMLNATEIYAGRYNGTEWTTERLTENAMADMSPTIASSGSNAIVAWRSLSATEMPEEGSGEDLTAMFNAENSINYRIFNGSSWKEAKIAYNGSAGTVNAIDSAMLSDGTALLVYTVRTGDDVKTSETFYTLINPQGEVVTTGRLTNDGYTDANAQVSAVGNQFIVGWYSEHEAGEENGTKETVVSHDIGLARINANGSVDANFPQSIGGTSDSRIGSDFHFSAPANNNDLSKLSIVWSQQKESDKAEDAGKYQLNAVRFYQEKESGVIGVTAPTKIAETNKNYAIDKFDTYTDEDGNVNAILIGSDYSNIDGLSTYDTIDLTNLPVQTVDETGTASNLLNILETKPTSSIKLAKGAFQPTAIEAEANTDLYNLMPGIDQPVQFAVKNTGTSKISNVSVDIGGQTKQFTGLDLLPGQSTVLTANYNVPESVQDVDYTLTADNRGIASGTLVLNRPDVGISSMKITTESDKRRNVQLILKNASEIPLVGSGKTVKLAFYKDAEHTQKIDEDDITIEGTAYQDIDNDLYVYNKTIDVENLIGNAKEIPEEGVRIYAHVWVEDVDELYTEDNDASVTFKSLLTKYQSQITMDSALIENNDGTYSVNANISNNSLQDTAVGSITADILDSKNKVMASVPLTQNDLTLTGEQTTSLTTNAPKLNGTPKSVSLRSSAKTIVLDPGRGSCDAVTMELNADNKIGSALPTATRSGYVFSGWYTKASGGEKVTNDTVLEGGATIYAHYSYQYYSQSWTLTMDSYEYDGTAHTPTFINGEPQGRVHYTYYDADTNKLLAAAPSKVGNYKVQVYAEGGSSYYGRIQTVKYSISEPENTIIEDAVSINELVPTALISSGKTRVRSGFSYNVADGLTVTEVGMIYSNDGTINSIEELKTGAVDGNHIKTTDQTDGNILDKGFGTVVVGFVKVKDGSNNDITVYTDDLGGKFTELSANIVEFEPIPVLSNDKTRVRSQFTCKAADGWIIIEKGLLYSNDGTITSIEELKNGTVDGNHIKITDQTDGNILDKGFGTVVVGFVKVKDSSNNDITVYTDDLGGKYSELAG